MYYGWLWRVSLIVLGCLVFGNVGAHSHTVFEITYDQPLVIKANGGISSEGTGLSTIDITPGQPLVPWLSSRFGTDQLNGGELSLKILSADTLNLDQPLPPAQPRIITSDTSHQPDWVPPDLEIYGADRWLPDQSLRFTDLGQLHGQTITSLEWCPFRYNPVRRQLIIIRRALVMSTPIRPSSAGAVADTVRALENLHEVTIAGIDRLVDRPDLTPGINGAPSWTWPADPPLGIEWVAITRSDFVDDLRPLVSWKARRGIDAGLATVEAIEAGYPGIDGAESVRNYLRAAYESGLHWVVLAGDETLVPMRLAYAGYKQDPPDPYQLQICDLYFAELDGDWDTDGDGIWGEYLGDEPELTTELHVGRLPFSESTEAEAIIKKIIAYEAGPANADYLTEVLDVSADQMRDWSDGTGQHEIVAASTPDHWQHNNNTMVELPTGDSPSPIAPDGSTLPSLLSEGYGWVNYYTHGRADGIVVRAPGYEGYPKSYVWTFGDSGDGHGHLNAMAPTATPGIHVSIGCDHGGFDMDRPPFAPAFHESVAERLLFVPDGGAAAFIGQSRWGWVSTSYRLIQKLYDAISDSTLPNHIGLYHTLMKQSYPSYRDLIYGNNLYGDPEMPVWKDAPRDLDMLAPETYTSGLSEFTAQVSGDESSIPGLVVSLAIGDSVWMLSSTGMPGIASAEVDLPTAPELVLTASAPGYRTDVDTVPHSIVTDVNDDNPIPRSHEIALSNYPNPFNPSTVIRVDLPQSGHTELTVYNVLGQPVAHLVDGYMTEGTHHIPFGRANTKGQSLASGIYLARLRVDGHTTVRKMVLMR